MNTAFNPLGPPLAAEQPIVTPLEANAAPTANVSSEAVADAPTAAASAPTPHPGKVADDLVDAVAPQEDALTSLTYLVHVLVDRVEDLIEDVQNLDDAVAGTQSPEYVKSFFAVFIQLFAEWTAQEHAAGRTPFGAPTVKRGRLRKQAEAAAVAAPITPPRRGRPPGSRNRTTRRRRSR